MKKEKEGEKVKKIGILWNVFCVLCYDNAILVFLNGEMLWRTLKRFVVCYRVITKMLLFQCEECDTNHTISHYH
jgi:hypothetical protein